MGCAGSKLDDLEAVALCRYRLQFLTEAIEQRYALAGAHASYIQSLHSVGSALHRFFLINELHPPHSASPVLALPTQRKGDPSPLPPLSPLYPIPSPSPPAAVAAGHQHSHSNSGSHIQFRSSEEDDDSDDDEDGMLHSDHGSPFHHVDEMDDVTATKTTTTTYFNFAKKGAASSSTVTYEQRPPFSSDVNHVQFGGFGDPYSSASTYGYNHGDPYAMNQNQNYYGGGGGESDSNSHPYSYPPPYAYPPAYGSFFKSSSPPPPPVFAQPPPASSTQRDPPPPPSPPRASPWEFLNPFESYQSYQPAYTPSRSSRDLREEEGIPDLEDEEQEVVKEAYGDQKSAAGASSSNTNGVDVQSSGKGVVVEEDARRSIGGEEMRYQGRAGELEKVEAQTTDKNVVINEMLQPQTEGGLRRKVEHGSRSAREVVHEIEAQFDRASASCKEIGKMLEVGKLQYHRRKYEDVSSKVRYAITPSLSTAATSKISNSTSNGHPESDSLVYLDFDEEKGMKAGNLSSTLQKIYVWEKKLLEEVKAEEKIRLCHDRERKRLKRLDDRGAEPQKIDSSRALVMKLSTKIKIAIQVVDGISNRIHKLRDEELWSELHELIQGLVGMWQAMTECHRSQFQAVMESKNLDAAKYSFVGNLSEDHMDATLQLLLELVNWIDIFSSWINSQKCFVRSLNGWLMKILPDEQEETADGIAPFSPGRLGAPPIFVICNYWSQAIERITEIEVLEAIRSFTSSVMQVRKEGIMANQGNDRRLKTFERDDQKIYKAVDAINKRLMQVTSENSLPYAGDIIHLKPGTENSSLKGGLQQIFEATERFSEQSMRVYEELQVRCEEESSQANGRAS